MRNSALAALLFMACTPRSAVVDDATSKTHPPLDAAPSVVVRAPATAHWSVVLRRIEAAAEAKVHCRLAITGEEETTTTDELLWGDPPPPPIDGIILDAAGAIVPRERPAPTGIVVVQADAQTPFESVVRVIRDVQKTGARVMIGVVPRARPADMASWVSCPFPIEADQAKVDEAWVTIEVDVGEDTRARSVHVITDPGVGFGAAAAVCAMQARYTIPIGSNGRPTPAKTRPFRVHFVRDRTP